MTPDLEKEGPVESTSSKSVQRQSQRNLEEEERSQENSRKVQRKSQLEQTLPTRLQDTQIGAFSMDNVFNMARTLMEFTAKEQERMKKNFPCR
ncbi:hypothetical protein O181_038131 [Austropuccinia psidii MF-1]|uniref:Uncharacterized protein n=1 Tax=Austropuccinia psidii MF-1 TaxID=1389203 RepID=A0A9Q3HBD7_9BASI|nr:hypothetical protein [Austropuccinia psidii MF-1]